METSSNRPEINHQILSHLYWHRGGSSNWAYCENCKSLFFLLEEKLSLSKKVGLVKSDFRLFDNRFADKYFDESLGITHNERQCKVCDNIIASHITTFSYRKSFRTSAYPAIWSKAEEILADSNRWIFIGYSLPEADFEFKHLIKNAELRFRHKRIIREIDIVIYNDKDTENKYNNFFGADNIKVTNGGLKEYVSSF